MISKVIYYRKLANKTQKEMSDILNITTQGYRLKENGQRQFKDKEKVILKEYFNKVLNKDLTIDEIFF